MFIPPCLLLSEVASQAYHAGKSNEADNNNVVPVRSTDPLPDTPFTQSATALSEAGHRHSETFDPSCPTDQHPPHSITPDPKSSQMSTSAGTDSGIGLEVKSSLKGSNKSSKGADVKKAFSSAFSNLTDKLKNTFDDGASDDLDSLSLKTDTSDDDDFEHMSLDDIDEVPAFIHEGRSDAGSNPDTYSDMDASSIYADSSTTKGREMVKFMGCVHSLPCALSDALVLFVR